MKRTATALSIALAALFTLPAQAAPDLAMGKKLYTEAKCTQCHGEQGYAKKGERVKDMGSLKTMVQACATNFNRDWFDEDVAAVAAYVNSLHFKFK
ncbi:MAG: hypothetical protein ACOZAQ_05965 [Pseudomonadota bacterium]